MSDDDFTSGFTRAFGGKNKATERVGRQLLNDTMSFRTRHLGDGGMLRTKGGHPQVTYETVKSEGERLTPSMHGRIENDTLYVYDDMRNIPTGSALAVSSPWYGGIDKLYNNGNTEFVANIDLTTANTDALWGLVANCKAGISTLFGYKKFRKTPDLEGMGYNNSQNAYSWLYQAPSGKKYRITYWVAWSYTWGGWEILRGSSRTFKVSMIAEWIKADGTLESPADVLLDEEEFTVENILPNLPVGGGPGARAITFDYIGGYLSGRSFGMDGISVSPTGNEALFNFIVTGGIAYLTTKYTFKVMKITISEGSPGVLTATLSTHKTEAQCNEIFTEVNTNNPTSGPSGTSWQMLDPIGNPGVWTYFVVTSPEVNTDLNYEFRAKMMLLCAYEPNNSATNTIVEAVGECWFKDRQVTTTTRSASGTAYWPSGSSPESFSIADNYSYYSFQDTFQKYYAYLGDDVALSFEFLSRPNETLETNYDYSCSKDTFNGPITVSGPYSRSGYGAERSKAISVNGAVEHRLVWEGTWSFADSGNVTSVGSDGGPLPYPGKIPDAEPRANTASGDLFNYVGADISTNNAIVMEIQADYAENPAEPWWTLPSDCAIGDHRYLFMATGHTKTTVPRPATYKSKWTVPGTTLPASMKFAVSWNPRRPALWAFSTTKRVCWV